MLGHEVLTQREQIEPPIWRTLQAAIVEVESVDVEIGPHSQRLSPIVSKAVNRIEISRMQKTEAAPVSRRGLDPGTEAPGGVTSMSDNLT